MSRQSRLPAGNRLLDSLPRQSSEHLLAQCELTELSRSEVLFEPEQRFSHAFFPVSGYISLINPSDSEGSLETGLVGNEGMLATPLLLGVDLASKRALVQGPGAAWRIKAASFGRELERNATLRRVLNRYLYVVQCQLAQTAVCTRFHVVEERLARCLLMTGDRAQCDEFYITQEFIAAMLGVRRAGITGAANLLKKRSLIRYCRGRLTILDRPGLQVAACPCYAAARETYAKILGVA